MHDCFMIRISLGFSLGTLNVRSIFERLQEGICEGASCAKILQPLTGQKTVLLRSFNKFSREPKTSHQNPCQNMLVQLHTKVLWIRCFHPLLRALADTE